MKILCFGNPNFESDRLALDVGKKLRGKIPGAEFFECGLYDTILDAAAEAGDVFFVLDVVKGIDSVRLVAPEELKLAKTVTAHDIDISFYVRLLAKQGKEIRIIGVPEGLELKRAVDDVKKLVRSLI